MVQRAPPSIMALRQRAEAVAAARRQAILTTPAIPITPTALKEPEAYAEPFIKFLGDNPTVFHAVDYFAEKLTAAGYTKVCMGGLAGANAR